MQEVRPAAVSLKSSCTIKPAGPTPTHRLWLSDLDQILPMTHAPTVYFYRRSDDDTTFFSPDGMKNALSQALVKFYPLAGRLLAGHGGRLELDCNAMGAWFVEAESDCNLDDLGDFRPQPGLRKLVPSVDYKSDVSSWPLVLVQLTFFRCGGVSLGLGICHTIADGFGSLHFVSTWARIARGDTHLGVEPFFDRTLLRGCSPPLAASAFKHEEFDPVPLLIGHEDSSELRRKETEIAMLKLSPEQVNKLRQEAPGYSRFLAVAGHLWRTACRARGLRPEQLTTMSFTVDGRRRLNPPLPEGYFGNAVFITTMCERSEDVVSKPLSYALSRGRDVVEKMSDGYLRSALAFLAAQEDLSPYKRGSHTLGCTQGNFYGCPNLSFTSWLGLPIYDADFGWGPPVHMGPAAVGFDGKAFLMPCREGNGGLLIAIRLIAEHMEGFKAFFYDGL